MQILLSILIFASWGADPALEQGFSLTELEKIQARGNWGEVVFQAKKVPAADQGPTWRGLVGRSSRSYLNQLHAEGTLDGFEMAISLPKEFPFLLKDVAFLKVRHRIAVEGLTSCYENPFTWEECTDRARELVRAERNNTDFVQRILEVVASASYTEASALVVQEVLNKANASSFCARRDFKNGLKALWGSTDWNARFTATKMARGPCYSILKGWLREKVKDGGQMGAEICKLFAKQTERVPACASSPAETSKSED